MTADLRKIDAADTPRQASFGTALVRFVLALLIGTAVGVTGLIANVFISDGAIGWQEIFEGISFFGVFVGTFTLAGMVAIGLPVTAILAYVRLEKASIYAALGAVSGFIIIGAFFVPNRAVDPESFIIPLVGAACGFASALYWGRWRESEAKRKAASAKPGNPVHDLLF